MGGHGALTLYLASIYEGVKQYRSVSAFSPISNPINCPWGQKAFNGYLKGGIEEAKERYDATELVQKIPKSPVHVLIDYVSVWFLFGSLNGSGVHLLNWLCLFTFSWASSPQGTADNFLKQGQLLPENFLKAARDAGYDEVQVRVRSQEGYDHSYYFVSTLLLDIPRFREYFLSIHRQISTFGADHVHCKSLYAFFVISNDVTECFCCHLS